MVERACKYVIGAREKGPGMWWSEAGANAVAPLRVLLGNDQWPALAACPRRFLRAPPAALTDRRGIDAVRF